jgi:hypothetical protein
MVSGSHLVRSVAESWIGRSMIISATSSGASGKVDELSESLEDSGQSSEPEHEEEQGQETGAK